MKPLSLLVLTSCTGKKKFKPLISLTFDDFQDKERLKEKSKILFEYKCSAGELYTGFQHLYLMEGVQLLREAFGKKIVDIQILSAGYGLLSEYDQIYPYEVTFNELKSHELDNWSKKLDIKKNIESLIAKYDLIFVLLGEKYLRALSLPVSTQAEQTFVFLSSELGKKYISISTSKYHVVELSNQHAKDYGCGLVGLKGFLFRKFCEKVISEKKIIQDLYSNPHLFLDLIQTKQKYQIQLSLDLPDVIHTEKSIEKPSKLKKDISFLTIPDSDPAPNIKLGMQYFIPEWDDHVDPKYDFHNDVLTPGRDTYEDEVYAHQIYSQPNYDGILVSKVVVESSKKKKKKIIQLGIHDFIRFSGMVMGDCGAFGYITEEIPPYETEEILDYYQTLGFNFGVSIDHLIVGDFSQPGVREQRYYLTINNAQKFLDLHRAGEYSFTPIGAVQGWNPETYAESVKSYIDMGYDYIAIGGVARAPTKEIIKILQEVRPHLKSNTRLHLFGVARIDAIPIFRHLGVTSFDSASPLRRAWLGSGKNYDTILGNSYSAIRVPPVNKHGVRVKKLLEANISDKETLEKLEKNTLHSLREFEKGNFDIEETLKSILEYDSLLELPRDGIVDERAQAKRNTQHEVMYREILEDRPWKNCNCIICQEIGIEVMIFRGNDRNRRRGFHNTFIFYKRFKEMLEKLNQKID